MGEGHLERERATIEAMVRLFCERRHGATAGLCEACGGLLGYAEQRLRRCPFADEKPPCADCPIHCYKPAMRDRVKEVMRYAGPRMMLRHPLFALRHWLDSFRKEPPAAKKPRGERT
ncbi:MAG: nitrous oxide-stimulated promoter family protein [Acidobacteria bacterium]|nr:nitrous oxide-stimulated promoter family protein [Acidobacteriota bacterium]